MAIRWNLSRVKYLFLAIVNVFLMIIIIIVIIKLSHYDSATGRRIGISGFDSYQRQEFVSFPLRPHLLGGPANGIFNGNRELFSRR
jgi:hypothetical protein